MNRPNQGKCGLSCISIYPAKVQQGGEVGRKGPGKNSTASVSLGELGPSPLLLSTAEDHRVTEPSTILEKLEWQECAGLHLSREAIWPTQNVESCMWGWRGLRPASFQVRSRADGWYVSPERFWSLPPRHLAAPGLTQRAAGGPGKWGPFQPSAQPAARTAHVVKGEPMPGSWL